MKQFDRQDLIFRYVKRLLSEMTKDELEQFFADVQFESFRLSSDQQVLDVILTDYPDLEEFVLDTQPVIKVAQAT